MDTVKFVPMLIGLLLAVVMVGAVFVPVISSSTTRTVTTVIENEGAGWLALGYNEGTDYSFTVGFDSEDNFTVGTQTGEYDDMICYADPQRTLFVSGDYWYLLTKGETPSVYQFTDNASVTNASGTLTILDGSETVYTGASPTWAYVPDSNGVYGFFTDGGLNLEEGKPKVAVGSYAGVFAYNETVVGMSGYTEYGLEMSGDYANGEVIWVTPVEEESLDTLNLDTLSPAVVNLEPINIQPIDLGDDSQVGLMSVPTPSYTTGDWGYNIASNNRYWLVAYVGEGGDVVTVPGSVEGNTFYSFGNNNEVFPAGVHINKLIVPEGFSNFGSKAFYGSDIDYILIPEGTYYMAGNMFQNSAIKHLDLPVNGISYGYANKIIDGCSNLTGLVILPGTPTSSAPVDCFSGATALKEVLNLSTLNITTTSYGLIADSVQDHVTALGYIAPTSIHESEVVPIDSPVAGLMQMLPLIAGIGALFFAVGTMIYTRF